MDKVISYKRYYNHKYFNSSISNIYLDKLTDGKKYFWSTTGRNGLRILFDLLQFKKGDKILVPAFVAHGIILPIKKSGLIPIYYKSDSNLIPDIIDIEEKIKKELNIVALVFIHYFGFPQEPEPLINISKKYNLISIEDCAQAFFSTYKNGELIGSKGDITLFSLTKFLPIPDGSLFVINNDKLKVNIDKIEYKFSMLSWLSIILARIQLLINTKLIQIKNNFLSTLFKLTYKIITPLHYILICSVKKPVNISKYSKELLSNLDIKKIVKQRKENISLAFKKLNLEDDFFYREYKSGYCLTGIPLKFINRDQVLNKLKIKKIKPLVYNKFWWFLSKKSSEIFKKERVFYNEHLLLPINENLNKEQINYIVKTMNDINVNKENDDYLK